MLMNYFNSLSEKRKQLIKQEQSVDSVINKILDNNKDYSSNITCKNALISYLLMERITNRSIVMSNMSSSIWNLPDNYKKELEWKEKNLNWFLSNLNEKMSCDEFSKKVETMNKFLWKFPEK